MPELVYTMGDLPATYEFREIHMVRGDGFFLVARFQTADLETPYELVDRAHPRTVTVLPVDERNRVLWLIEQPRYARAFAAHAPLRGALDEAIRLGGNEPNLSVPASDVEVLESPAGIVDPGETLEEAAVRELLEEAGFTVDPQELEFVRRYFSSGGGITEDVVCFIARLQEGAAWSPPKGDGEKMRVWKFTFNEAFALLDEGRIESPGTLMMLHALRDREQKKRIAELEARLALR